MARMSPRIMSNALDSISVLLIVATVVLAAGKLLGHPFLSSLHLPAMTICVACAMLLVLWREGSVRERLHLQTQQLQRKVDEAEEKNRWLQLTEASAHVGHWRLDLRTDAVYWSDETFRIHGREPGDTPALDEAIDCFHPDDRSIVTQAVDDARRTGKPFTFRARIVRPNGEWRHAESIAQLEYDEQGNPTILFGVLADRTDEEAMRRELRDARDQAKALAEAKSLFLARMSHEIRNPMNGVLGFVDLLLTSDLSPSQRRHADLIAESGRNLQTLLGDILDMSKIEAKRMKVHPKPTNLEHLIRSATRLAEPLAREKSLQLDCSLSPSLPSHVMVDPLRLRQIISNLLSNAVRYTDHGGITVIAKAQDSQFVLSVFDTGIGIEASAIESIFDAFAMVDPADVDQRGGTGLGLPICQQLAELMGGTITLESEPGKGSCFTVTLPLIEAGQEHAPLPDNPALQQPEFNASNTPILLAEDFDINRELVTDMAQRLGLSLQEAHNGEQAVRMVQDAANKEQPFSLVLMDIQMPVMDGITATKAIREAGFDPASLPIIALTANAYAEDIAACKEAGMQDHLAKPLSFEAFRTALQRWLPADKARAA